MSTARISRTSEREQKYEEEEKTYNAPPPSPEKIAASPIVSKKKKIVVVKVSSPPVPISDDEEEEGGDNLPEGIKEIKNSNFQVKNQQFLLTYKTHIDKELFKEFIEVKCEEFGCEVIELYICHENGKADSVTPYQHSHVYFKCVPALRATDCTVFDIPSDPEDEDSRDIHPNIKTVGKGLANEWGAKYYITKEDTSPDLVALRTLCIDTANKKKFHLGGGKSGEVVSDIPIADRVWRCETLREALRTLCTSPKDASGIRAIWEEKELAARPKIPFKVACDWSWQLYLRDKLLTPGWDHRLLHWIVGKLGAEGKSTFANYFINNYGGVYLSSCSGSSNIATVLAEHIKSGGSTKHIFVDLPRAAKMHKMWDTLEAILNGVITVMKYKGHTCRLGDPKTGKPRVIVFSNWSPPFDVKTIKAAEADNKKNPDSAIAVGMEDTLSYDRWEIGDIFSSIDSNGEPDRILTFRKNPFRTKYVKPTRFDHLGDDFL